MTFKDRQTIFERHEYAVKSLNALLDAYGVEKISHHLDDTIFEFERFILLLKEQCVGDE